MPATPSASPHAPDPGPDRDTPQAPPTPTSAEALLRRGQYVEACVEFAALLVAMDESDPARDLVTAGLGAAEYGAGALEAAADRLAAVLERGVADDRTWILLAYALLALGRRQALDALAGRARAGGGPDPLVASAITTLAAAAAYAAGEPALCRLALAEVTTGPAGRRLPGGLLGWRRMIESRLGRRVSYNQRPVLNALGLRDHLAALLTYRTDNLPLYDGREDGVLHVVGDSHCLAPGHLHVGIGGQRIRVAPHLVYGAKAWHLAPENSPAPNPHRVAVERIAAALPPQAVVVAMFGETDCRADEGIARHLKATPWLDPEDYCDRLADDYVGHIAETFGGPERGVMIYGVPAPTKRAAALAGRAMAELIAVTGFFNRALGEAAEARGLPFLDPYRLTVNERGLGNGHWHLDDTHLSPDLFRRVIEEADAAAG